MPDPKAAIYVLGCKVNQTEADSIAGMFRSSGYQIVDFSEKADVYVIHTCTVTRESDRKSRNLIRRAVRSNPLAVVAVTGCFAQVSSREIESMEGVDLVLGVGSLKSIVERVEEVRRAGSKPMTLVHAAADLDGFESLPAYAGGRVRAFLKVQEGCRQFCSYCIVPYARGPVRSRPPEETIDQVKKLVEAGFQEIVLTGIRLGAYGQDLQPSRSLADLVEAIALVPGLHRLRLSSVDPNDFTPGLVEVITNNPVVCPHYHIPLQSGDDEILSKMRRRYDSKEYLRLIEELCSRRSEAAFATDVMVGFPGEQDKHFENTKRLLQEVGFMGVHIFKYSPRQGTPAADFPEQVSPEMKAKRSRELAQLSEELFLRYAERFLHQVSEVLVEQRDREGLWEGHTPNYLLVKLQSEQDLKNRIIEAKITEIGKNFVFGEGVGPKVPEVLNETRKGV